MKAFAASSLAAALYTVTASADPLQACPNDICFQVAVPQAASSSGSGNMYFQMSAPTSYQWVALGTGSTMSNSNMFIMYTDGSGNVTISPRTARGHNMPTLSSSTDLQLLAGSGVKDGKMIANVLCTNCASWSSGSLALNSATSSWIGAWKAGSAINSASTSQSIQQHDDHTNFNLDLTKATVQTDSNPFEGTSGGGSGSGTGSGNGSGSGSGSGNGNGNGGSTSGGVVFNGGSGGLSNVLLAHGIIMSIVFIFLYPVGAILMPLLGKWMAHAAWQSVAFLLMWAGFGTGYVYARDNGYLFAQTHTLLGTVVVAMLAIQPFLGVAHHKYYKKYQTRGVISHTHIWYGRALMLLGIINGGLGLELASSSRSYVIAYSVIAAIIGVAWIGSAVWGEIRRSKRTVKREQSHDSPESQQRIPYRQKK
ncbi:integral membrane protein [Colletotrichum sublineola]|uniref:Putative integral membrane protein n=1 Tax=Colletotrichum sublineola TaxID=1173701 RepID=A0A066XS41_COLSU|nr:integral membrane protein [Colletotrichum sublineola]KDN68780.1 putative integral membrane protein [Colletotrichum sublineola]